MPLELALTPAASADITAIWDHTRANWGRSQAFDYLTGLDKTFDLLAAFPAMARLHTEYTPPVRLHPYRSHLIVYQFDENTLTVVRVPHSRSDWAVVLAEP